MIHAKGMFRGFGRYLSIVLFIFIASAALMKWAESSHLHKIVQEDLRRSRLDFQSAQRIFDLLSQNFYNEHNEHLARMLYLASRDSSSLTRQEEIRRRLLDRYASLFHHEALYGLVQFQLHTSRGHSFLRFSRSDFYGDDLASIRPSLRIVAKKFLALKGFEVGRLFVGLRYIYPLFYHGEYVGSYEWVWDPQALLKEIRRIYGSDNAMIWNATAFRDKLDRKALHAHYGTLENCPAYLYRLDGLSLGRAQNSRWLQSLQKDPSLCRDLHQNKEFARTMKLQEGDLLLVSFLPIRDISGKPLGYFLSFRKDPRLLETSSIFETGLLLLSIVMLIILALLYKAYLDRVFIRTVLDSQKDLILLTDGKRPLDANQAFFDFFGVANIEEFLRTHHCIERLFLPQKGFYSKKIYGEGNWLLSILRRKKEEPRVVIFDPKSKEKRIFLLSLNRVKKSPLFVVSFRDVTDLEEEKRHFEIEALYDHLTKVYNKRAFERYLAERIRDLRYYRHSDTTLIMFDLDNFKTINDTYGHKKGDEVLRELTALVQRHIRRSDFLARWGGDEFMIVMEGVTAKEAESVTEKLRQDIIRHTFSDLLLSVSCSFGITQLRASDSVEEALNRVDTLLYRAKKGGKNRIAIDHEEEDKKSSFKNDD